MVPGRSVSSPAAECSPSPSGCSLASKVAANHQDLVPPLTRQLTNRAFQVPTVGAFFFFLSLIGSLAVLPAPLPASCAQSTVGLEVYKRRSRSCPWVPGLCPELSRDTRADLLSASPSIDGGSTLPATGSFCSDNSVFTEISDFSFRFSSHILINGPFMEGMAVALNSPL